MSDPALQLQAYLVGGAVRDRLLGLERSDRDWVVVGATPSQMTELGFRPIGRDFPVFLHPQTHEEYALARTERKSGTGYRGFTVYAAPDVTLEEDLLRRDLTINAMAIDQHGNLIDPHGGQADLSKHILRHVSPAFVEDPVRVLRVARFAARFAALGSSDQTSNATADGKDKLEAGNAARGFQVAPDTMQLMTTLVDTGEVTNLVPERVFAETRAALQEHKPSQFFLTLRECGALKVLFAEVDALFGVPQTALHHPEIDTGVHIMMVIDSAANAGASTRARFAALCHDLGKGITPAEILPRHHGHESGGVPLVDALCQRLKVPNDYLRTAQLVCRHHLKMHKLIKLKASTIVNLLDELGAYRDNSVVADFIASCKADLRGRLGKENASYPQAELLQQMADITLTVDARPFIASGLQGPAIGDAVRNERISRIKAFLTSDSDGSAT